MKTLKTFLPVFSGFYNTIFEADETSEIEYINEERKSLGLKPLDFNDFEFDYEYYNDEMSKACCTGIESLLFEFISDIKFEKLVSPKYYNYSTDSINCTIKFHAGKVNKYLKDNFEEFSGYIAEKYTSRSGFISHYPNDAKEFLKNKYGEHEIGSIFEFICQNEGIDSDTLYNEVSYVNISVVDFDDTRTKTKCEICGEWTSQLTLIDSFNSKLKADKAIYFELMGYYPKEVCTVEQWIAKHDISTCYYCEKYG